MKREGGLRKTLGLVSPKKGIDHALCYIWNKGGLTRGRLQNG